MSAEDLLSELLVMFNQDKIRFTENASLPHRQIRARMAEALKVSPPNAYHVALHYRTKRQSVVLSATEIATDEGRAYMQAVRQHIRPFKARKLQSVSIECEAPPKRPKVRA